MSKIKQSILAVLSNLALLLSFLVFLSLILVFIYHRQVFDNAKSVLSWIFEILSSFSIVAYLGTRIKAGIKKYGSLSESLKKLLIDEPLIHALVWVFVIFMIGIFCYMLPIHFLTLELYDQSNEQILDKKTIERVDLLKKGLPYRMTPNPGNLAVYACPRFLTWGDSVTIHGQAKGYLETNQPIAWPTFAIFNIFDGVHCRILLQRVQPFRISLNVTNATSANIHFTSPVDTQFTGVGIIEASPGNRIEVEVSLLYYATWDTTFYADGDFVKDLRLKQKPVRIILRAFDRNGAIEYENMDVYIGGTKMNEKSGEVIRLLPGTYDVIMVKELQPHERAVVNKRITITASDHAQEMPPFTAILENF
jgi:hypothetical protein